MSKELTFNPISSFVDINFWQEFSNLKLDKLKLDDKPLNVFGTYTPPVNSSTKLSVLSISESCLPDVKINTIGGMIEAKVSGIFHNTNTIDKYLEADKKAIAGNFFLLLDKMVKDLEETIKKPEWMDNPDKLLQFYISTFVDFKQYFVKYK